MLRRNGMHVCAASLSFLPNVINCCKNEEMTNAKKNNSCRGSENKGDGWQDQTETQLQAEGDASCENYMQLDLLF